VKSVLDEIGIGSLALTLTPRQAARRVLTRWTHAGRGRVTS
jgi:hypothetical protein